MKSWKVFVLMAFMWNGLSATDDLPCIARYEEAGQSYMCICNSTYCDTLNRPSKSALDSGSYYYYKTSNSTPGFNKATGDFVSDMPFVLNEVTFTIDSSTQYQEIVGFGGSVTDSVGSMFNTLNKEAQDKLLEAYFGSTGIEYSMLRIPIGSTDFSDYEYTLDDTPFDKDLEHFKLNDADNNLKIPLLKRIIEMSEKEIKIIACTWVAPAWMKDGDNPYSTFILHEYDEAWAGYHVKFVQAYKEQGVDIWALSSPNEPMLIYLVGTLFKGSLNFTETLAPQQRAWLKDHLKPQLVANNLTDVKFFALEDVRIFASYFMERFALDQEAYDALDGIALHTYFDWYWPASTLDELYYKYPDKLLLYTENSINDEFGFPALIFGSWYHAEIYLYNTFENLNHFVQSYIDWNLALNTEGGPSRSQALDCAMLINETSGEFYKQPIYYAMGHFSKFILPGAKRVKVEASEPIKSGTVKGAKLDLLASKIRSVSEGIALNITVPQTISCLAFSNPDESFTVMVLNTKNMTIPVKIVDKRVGVIALEAEQQSINTFVYWPPSSTDPLTNDSDW